MNTVQGGGWLAATLCWCRHACRVMRRPAYQADRRICALETVLDGMAERVAQAELLAERHASHAQRCQEQLRRTETLMLRLQENLDHARRRIPA